MSDTRGESDVISSLVAAIIAAAVFALLIWGLVKLEGDSPRSPTVREMRRSTYKLP